MFVILYTLKEDKYVNWKISEYTDFQQALSKYEEYCSDDKIDTVRFLNTIDSTYK